MGATKPNDLTGHEFFGQSIRIGEYCKICGTQHYCDAICFKFSPHYFMCLCCNLQRRHRPMTVLIKEFQMSKLLWGISTPGHDLTR